MTSKTRKTSASSDNVYDIITTKIIASLEKGVAPWRKPWNVGQGNGGWPRNIAGNRYRGVNVWLLWDAAAEGGYTSPYWLTFNQAKEHGGNVRKGEKSTVIVFWKRLMINEKQDDGSVERKMIPMLRYYRVFNLEQTENVKLPKRILDEQTRPVVVPDPIEAAEQIVSRYLTDGGPSLRLADQDRAYYTPMLDTVTVPPIASYTETGEYYSTLFHELGHSTGHKDRLNRTYGQQFGDHQYGREELVAEMTSAFLAAEAGIETTQDNSASYLASWISTLKEDNRAVVVAAGAAQRAADMILGRTAQVENEDQVAKAA